MRDFRSIVRERIAPLHLQAAAEASLVEELTQHLEDRYRELHSGGATEEDAQRKALEELNDTYPLRKEFRKSDAMPANEAVPAGDARSGNLIDNLWRDLRYAARAMRKNPIFVLFVVLTLALGIGANTTIFTIINTLILNPLPVKDSSHLAGVARTEAKSTSKSKSSLPMSYLDLKDYQARNEVFTSLAGYTSPRTLTLQTGGASQRMFSELVTGNYFSTLGLKPAVGRFFLTEEDSTPGAHAVAVMNYATWQGRFGGENDIVGKTLRLNNIVFTVIGVAPPRFLGVDLVFGPDLWIPAAMAEQLLPGEMVHALSDRSRAEFQAVGRLKPGVSQTQAKANIATVAAALEREYPQADKGHTATVRSVKDILYGDGSLLFGSMALLVVAGIVLLIACSNVANLLLARSAARQQEIAVRLAIGASRGRLVRQLLTESVSLGFISGAAGAAIGYAALQLLWSFLPPDVSFNLIAPKLDASVFIFTAAVSLLAGFLFGTVPALRASRASVAEALKEEARTVGRSRRRVTMANALLTGQVAFSCLSLVIAALFLRSIQRAYEIDPGFQTKHLAVFLTSPGQAGYGKAQTKAFYKEVRERVARLPGIESASWSLNLPFWGRIASGVQVEGRQQRSQADVITTVLNTVDLNYFETAGIAVDKGREFTQVDQENSTPVAIVNEKMAHDYWPNGEALGKRIQLPGEKGLRQIVGIARTANYSTLGEPPQRCIYVPLEQSYFDAMILYVRSKGDPQQILIPVQREMRAVAPQVLANDMRTGQKIVNDALFTPRIGVGLLSAFGLLALGLASIGLYGIMAYSVSQRQREIGVRMALGAARQNILRLILKRGMSLVLAGIVIGVAVALVIGRLLARMLYGVSASDPISVVSAVIVLFAIALLACYLPARRASRVDPLVALREG
ncbi:MAG TPA: ABC transporter permease [Bryobacteraceae bacterium]|jgi:predicted permease